jgi:glutamate/tyrosine decarboxylase-like PLP-dependent enzyme
MAERLCKYIDSLDDVTQPVVRLAGPDDLRAKFKEAGISISLAGEQKPEDHEQLMKATELLLQYSVRTGHPLFFNQLYARADPVAIAADWVSAATNTNCHTYEVAPVYTVMEREVLAKIASVIGGEFAVAFDGLFVPGGSLSNLYGMVLARNIHDPDFGTRGAVGGPHMVAFTSDQSHYSYLKSSKLVGLGTNNLIKVESDGQGRMSPAALEAAVVQAQKEGKKPFFVGATAGTTVLGAYDPFTEIADICKRHDMYLHVDACWGGGAMFSDKHRHTMRGVELADSIAWNPHKMSGLTLQCCAFVTRHEHLLAKTNGTQAAYLFQPDKLNGDLDSGDKTIQCGRKTDMFKLWLTWKAKGDAGMAATVDHCFDLASVMADKIRNDPSGAWQLVYEPSCSNVCFWYVPEKLRPFSWENATQEQLDEVNKVAPLIKNEMQRTGDGMIGFQAVNGRPNFFRIVFAAADTVTHKHIEDMMKRMSRIGEEQYNKVSSPASPEEIILNVQQGSVKVQKQ